MLYGKSGKTVSGRKEVQRLLEHFHVLGFASVSDMGLEEARLCAEEVATIIAEHPGFVEVKSRRMLKGRRGWNCGAVRCGAVRCGTNTHLPAVSV